MVLTFLNHFIPFLITVIIIGVAITVLIGGPYCRYIAIVSNADTDEGREELAKYLAKKAGGRKINVEHTWRSFLPAARDLHKSHVYKRQQVHPN